MQPCGQHCCWSLRQEQLLADWEGQPDKAFAASIIQYDLHRGGRTGGAVCMASQPGQCQSPRRLRRVSAIKRRHWSRSLLEEIISDART